MAEKMKENEVSAEFELKPLKVKFFIAGILICLIAVGIGIAIGFGIWGKTKNQNQIFAQETQKIFDSILKNGTFQGKFYKNLAEFVDNFGPRPVGSKSLSDALDFIRKNFSEFSIKTSNFSAIGFENFGEFEILTKFPRMKKISGFWAPNSPGIDVDFSPAVIVRNVEELNQISFQKLNNSILVLNQIWKNSEDSKFLFENIAEIAKNFNPKAILIRSPTPLSTDSPHLEVVGTPENPSNIPIATISIEDADFLARNGNGNGNEPLLLKLKFNGTRNEKIPSEYLQIDFEGREKENKEFILLGAHLDSWAGMGQGALNGAVNVFLSLETLKLFKFLNFNPKRKIRLVLFSDGNFGQKSHENFLENFLQNSDEIPVFAFETRIGGFKPDGIQISATDPEIVSKLQELLLELPVFSDLNLTSVWDQGSDPIGSDLEMIQKSLKIPGISLHPENSDVILNYLQTFWNTKGDFVSQLDPDAMDFALGTWASLVFILAEWDETSKFAEINKNSADQIRISTIPKLATVPKWDIIAVNNQHESLFPLEIAEYSSELQESNKFLEKYSEKRDQIMKEVLNGGEMGNIYWELAEFADKFGPRPVGQQSYRDASDFVFNKYKNSDLSYWSAHREEVNVTVWQRGVEKATILEPEAWKGYEMTILGLWLSPGTNLTADGLLKFKISTNTIHQ